MSLFSSLSPAEQARQLANPEGTVGVAVAEWLNGNNREGNARVFAMLELQPGCHVLEVGFGNGRAAREVVAGAENVRYEGIDISQTMVDEANRYNAEHVLSGLVRFHLAFADHMPFANGRFDRVFSIGVMHFWTDPLASLREIHRVMRPGGRAVMGALDAQATPPFAKPEFGFHLRTAAEWGALFEKAEFVNVDARTVESLQTTPEGVPTRRYSVRLTAQR